MVGRILAKPPPLLKKPKSFMNTINQSGSVNKVVNYANENSLMFRSYFEKKSSTLVSLFYLWKLEIPLQQQNNLIILFFVQ